MSGQYSFTLTLRLHKLILYIYIIIIIIIIIIILVLLSSFWSRSSTGHFYRCVQYFHGHTMVWLPGFGIFNMHRVVDACDCTQGLYRHHKTVCTGSWHWEKNPLGHQRLKHTSCQYCTCISSLKCCQLGHPFPNFVTKLGIVVHCDAPSYARVPCKKITMIMVKVTASAHTVIFMLQILNL